MMNNNDISAEMIKKAKEEKSVAGLLELAKANGIELTPEQADEYYNALHKSGELSDDELCDIAGGKCQTIFDEVPETKICPICGGVTHLYQAISYSRRRNLQNHYRCESCDYNTMRS